MSTYVTQIGKYKFVCGMFWQSLSRPRELAKEAADLARKIDCDMVVLRREYSTAQAGFAQSVPGPRQVLYSLAAAVASKLARQGANYDGENQPVHNWLAAFKLPDEKWAYFAVRDANFLPNGDFAGTREEVFERLHGDYGLGGWNLVIGDAELEDYGFHNFTERGIVDLLTSDGQLRIDKAWLVRPTQGRVSPKTFAISAGVTAAVILVCLGGWKAYQLREQRLRAAEEAELVQQLLKQRNALAAIPHPWATAPSPTSLAQACVRELFHLTAGGWALQEYECTAHGVRYTWLRQDSTVDLLLAQVPDAVIELDGNRASANQTLTLRASHDETLQGYNVVMPHIFSRLQMMNLPMKLSKQVVGPAKSGKAVGRQDAALKPIWSTYKYVISSVGISPLEVAAILDRPGIRLDKMIYRGTTWSMEGSIYAN